MLRPCHGGAGGAEGDGVGPAGDSNPTRGWERETDTWNSALLVLPVPVISKNLAKALKVCPVAGQSLGPIQLSGPNLPHRPIIKADGFSTALVAWKAGRAGPAGFSPWGNI